MLTHLNDQHPRHALGQWAIKVMYALAPECG